MPASSAVPSAGDAEIEHSVSTEFDHMTNEELRSFIIGEARTLGVDLPAPKARAKKH